jgi:hypothetical protein
VFRALPRNVPVNIEIKDKDSVKATEETVKLVQKYKRQAYTAIGGEENYVTERVLTLDQS